MKAYLEELLPRLNLHRVHPQVIDHSSKQKLRREIPRRLAGYARMPAGYRPLTLVLIDRDNDDCLALKTELEHAAAAAGLLTKSAAGHAPFDVVNRIVIEELEAWHFGDCAALADEYAGVRPSLGNQARFRNPDGITGGTHEALLRVLQSAGHHIGVQSLPKIDTARRMARAVSIEHNRSPSFQHFVGGLRALAAQIEEVEPNG